MGESICLANLDVYHNVESLKILSLFEAFMKKHVNTLKLQNIHNDTNDLLGSNIYYNNFILDHLGIQMLHDYSDLSKERIFPVYQVCSGIPYGETFNEEDENKIERKLGPKCFNCEGPHILSACLLPLDYKRIAKNKSEFLATHPSSANIASMNKNRYHDDEIEERFASFRPGYLSSNLRKALGISAYELPPFTYVMRMIGYPPGHLLDAQKPGTIKMQGSNTSQTTSISNISNIDTMLKDIVKDDNIDLQKTAVTTTGLNNNSYLCSNEFLETLDLDAIISYQGFNEPITSHRIHDEYARYNSLPMQKKHSKSTWKKLYNKYIVNGHHVRSKRNRTSSSSSDKNGINDDSDVNTKAKNNRKITQDVGYENSYFGEITDLRDYSKDLNLVKDETARSTVMKTETGDQNVISERCFETNIDSNNATNDILSEPKNVTNPLSSTIKSTVKGTPVQFKIHNRLETLSPQKDISLNSSVNGDDGVFDENRMDSDALNNQISTPANPETSKLLPSLEKFAEQIQPFTFDEHLSSVQYKGIFKKITSYLNVARDKRKDS